MGPAAVPPGMRLVSTAEVPPTLRGQYLQSLPESQELFVEALVQAGTAVIFAEGLEVVGYAAIHGQTIVEFFVRPHALAHAEAAFEALRASRPVTTVLCKSFDALLLSLACRRPTTVKTAGLLFRRLAQASIRGDGRWQVRAANDGDVERVLAVHEGFFDSPAELGEYVRARGLFVYESPGGALLGCGLVKRITPWQHFVDVGMLVAPAHRGQGLGAQIIADLIARCRTVGVTPVCGCDVSNVASRRALERAGFRSIHRLLEVALDRC